MSECLMDSSFILNLGELVNSESKVFVDLRYQNST